MRKAISQIILVGRLREQGLALIELMISLVLGLVIIGAVTGIMLSNMQSFRTTKGLSQIQDSLRVGYELLARDIRQAGNVPCGKDIDLVNILMPANTEGETPWQYDFADGIHGVAADKVLNGVDNRVDGTEALILVSGVVGNIYMATYDDDNSSANFTVGTADGDPHGLQDGEILLVCNAKQGTIFQMTNGSGQGSGTIVANTGDKQEPGNCTKGLGPIIPGNNDNQPCDINGNRGPYGPNTVVAKFESVAWYIGDTGRAGEGGRSLFMARLDSTGNSLTQIEIATGVIDVNLRYRLVDTSSFVNAGEVTNWADVNAVEVSLKLATLDRNISTDASENDGRLSRELTSVIAIRNRSL
ncbi:PilW family protein [Pseudomonas saliphila]|uniref:PilW family protein n=1 Tax=Pseudomonas saliphila TaxID=2586906 RepID=UPI0012391E98|nr:hypothetical protein [Pseudomonas saliphila]